MTQAIPKELRDKVIREYLKGKGRNKIAMSIRLGEGTVTNIIQEWRQQVADYEPDKIRELAIDLREAGITADDCVQRTRITNKIRELDIDEDKFLKVIEEIQMKSIEKGVPPEMCGELLSQLFNISQQENLSLDEIPNQLRRKVNEIKAIEEQLKQNNVTHENINSYLSLKESLAEIGIHDIDIAAIANIFRNFKAQGFDVNKVLKIVSSTIPLEEREEFMRNHLYNLQNSTSDWHQLVQLLKEIKDISAGSVAPNGLHMLLELINYRAIANKMSTEAAAQRIMMEIEQLHKIMGFEREIKAQQLQILALKNKREELDESWTKDIQAIETLVYLNEGGVTKDDIIAFKNFFQGNKNRVTLATLITDLNNYGNLKMTLFDLEEGIKTRSGFLEHLKAETRSMHQEKTVLQMAVDSTREKLYGYSRKQTVKRTVGKAVSSTSNIQSKSTQTTKTTSATTPGVEATTGNGKQSDLDSVHTN